VKHVDLAIENTVEFLGRGGEQLCAIPDAQERGEQLEIGVAVEESTHFLPR
jgi:hypothetical protein